jgi:hypothetical protein
VGVISAAPCIKSDRMSCKEDVGKIETKRIPKHVIAYKTKEKVMLRRPFRRVI